MMGPISRSHQIASASMFSFRRWSLLTAAACVDVFWDIARYVRYGTGSGGGHISIRQRPVATLAAVDGTGGGGGSLAVVIGGDDGSSLHHWTVAGLTMSSAANHIELAATSKVCVGGGRNCVCVCVFIHRCIMGPDAVQGLLPNLNETTA